MAICGEPTWTLKDMDLLASLGVAGSVRGACPAMKQIMTQLFRVTAIKALLWPSHAIRALCWVCGAADRRLCRRASGFFLLGLQHLPMMAQPSLHDPWGWLNVFAIHDGVPMGLGRVVRRRLRAAGRRDARHEPKHHR
jgi:hypothetical protein